MAVAEPDAPVSCLALDARDREVEGVGLVIETVRHDSGWQFAWVTVEVEAPLAVPDAPSVHLADPLEDAWEERGRSDGCPLAAVTALLARRECSEGGCAAYGTRSCPAGGRRDGTG